MGGIMLSKLITYIAVVLVLSLVIVPSPLLAADDDLLTAEEKQFVQILDMFIARAREKTSALRGWTSQYMNTQSVVSHAFSGKVEVPFPYGMILGNCTLREYAPNTMSDIADVWNTEVCNEYGSVSQKLTSYAEGVDVIEFSVGLLVIRGTLSDIESSISKIEGMLADRIDELKEIRKAEKEAKKELGLGDDFCFIATAAYGTPTAVEIDELRRFRDEYLRESSLGNEFIKFYYENSPPIAKFISEHEILRVIVREGVVEPVVKIVELTENLWVENQRP